jgi:hypothetical protein
VRVRLVEAACPDMPSTVLPETILTDHAGDIPRSTPSGQCLAPLVDHSLAFLTSSSIHGKSSLVYSTALLRRAGFPSV